MHFRHIGFIVNIVPKLVNLRFSQFDTLETRCQQDRARMQKHKYVENTLKQTEIGFTRILFQTNALGDQKSFHAVKQ